MCLQELIEEITSLKKEHKRNSKELKRSFKNIKRLEASLHAPKQAIYQFEIQKEVIEMYLTSQLTILDIQEDDLKALRLDIEACKKLLKKSTERILKFEKLIAYNKS